MSLKFRVLILSVVSLIAILILSYALIGEARHSLQVSQSLERGVVLSTKISELVHELQKERGRTAGFLGSGGKEFRDELQEQRRLTDEKIKELEKYLSKEYVSALPREAQEVFLSVILNKLNDISQIRIKVDSQQISLKDAINFYTQLDEDLIESVALLARHASNAVVAKELLAYADFMYAKEKAGLERAVLSVAFANQKFTTPQLFTKFVDLMAQQKAFIRAFSMAAPDRIREYYQKTVVSSEPSLEVLNYERLALSSPFTEGALNVDPDRWFSTITKKIDLMHRVESFIAKDLISRIEEIKSQAKGRLMGVITLSAIAIVVILIVSFISLRVKGEG